MIDPAAVFSGLGAIVTAAGGTALVIREFRRRDRIALSEEISELNLEVHELRSSFQAFRRFAYKLRMMMVDHGLEPPEPPIPDMGLSRIKEAKAAQAEALKTQRIAEQFRDERMPEP